MPEYSNVAGVYYLGRGLSGLVVREGRAVAVVTAGRRIKCAQVNWSRIDKKIRSQHSG